MSLGNQKILIIGGVAAGATAAARARRLDGNAEITILEAGSDVSFANCGLPYFIGGEVRNRSDLILASPETFRDQYRVDVLIQTEALAIDPGMRTVTARSQGNEITLDYTKLILAQGGKPIVPPLPGVDKPGVFQLWTLEDMDQIQGYIEEAEPQNAVVVGAGFIGLEMAEALAMRGIDVSLVEMADQVMPNLDSELAGMLSKELEDHGVSLYLSTSMKKFDGNNVHLSDGRTLPADMVILSVGVKPSLKLAVDAGLRVGESGALEVNEQLQTSNEHIFAAGDMCEINHRVSGRKVRIPLAGPANRQGRIAAENALGGSKTYRGAGGSSIVKVFGVAAGSTGMSLDAAREAGFDADAVVVHKASHTAYYPGSEKVSLMLVFDQKTRNILGAQVGGRVGVDKRIDVIATAIAGSLTIDELEEVDLAYAPPFNSPNGPVNMAAFTAVNKLDNFSPAVLARDLEHFVSENHPVVIDLRDPISFQKAHLAGSNNISQNMLRESMDQLPVENPVLLISEDGQKGHLALRMLVEEGIPHVVNLPGGYISLERHARAYPFTQLEVGLFPIEHKDPGSGSAHGSNDQGSSGQDSLKPEDNSLGNSAEDGGPLIVDVRTPGEFATGAYPDALSIPLDELPDRVAELGDSSRDIIVYCASGARSAYAQRILESMGFTNIENGGGLHDMMSRLNA